MVCSKATWGTCAGSTSYVSEKHGVHYAMKLSSGMLILAQVPNHYRCLILAQVPNACVQSVTLWCIKAHGIKG